MSKRSLLLEFFRVLVYNISDKNALSKRTNKIYTWRLNVKRKFGALLLVLIMCMSVFTGCSLVGRNDKAYFEAVVATISYTTGEKENITKRDLISAYNSYGYNYVENYGYTKEKAVTETLETIINKRLTIKAVENYYEENPSEGKILNGNETTYVWDETYNALYSNLKEYLNDVLDYQAPSGSNDETETDKSVYTPYNKNAVLEVVNGKYVIKKTKPATTIRENYAGRTNTDGVYFDYEYKDSDGNQSFKEAMYNKLNALIGNDNSQSSKNWKSAFNNYLDDIEENYKYLKLETDKDWFMFEMDRVYNIIKDNYLTEKYSVIYNMQNHQGADVASITPSDILKYYSAKVRVDYTSFVTENNVSSYQEKILSDVGSVDYILEGDNASNYFYAGYIKMNFDAKQSAKLASLKTQLEAGSIGYNEYKQQVDNLYNSVYATIRNSETGEKTENTISAQNLLNKINEEISNFKYISLADIEKMSQDEKDALMNELENEGKNLEQYIADYNRQISYNRADVFRTYLYLYNDDDTLKGADYNAVFGVNSSKEVFVGETFSSNDDAKEKILDLFDNGNAQIGDTTELVKADDGLYIFFYAGKIENLFNGIDGNFDASKQAENIKTLASTRLNIFSNKTIFDKLYDELTKDNFSVFENMNMNYLRSSLTSKIQAVENNFKDLYK